MSGRTHEAVLDATQRLSEAAAKRNRALPRPDVIVKGGLERRRIVVRLFDGPCDGQYATMLGYGTTCWQRIPGPGLYWAKYVRSARGEFTFANEIMDQVAAAEWVTNNGRERVMGTYGA